MNKPRTPEKVSISDVENHVQEKENRVVVKTNKIRCGDGRYTPEQSDGAIRAFGEDFGIMLAVKAALLENGTSSIEDKRLVNAYENAVRKNRGEDGSLFAHSDEHAEKDGGTGCGHARESANPDNGTEYVAPSKEAKSLYEEILGRSNVDLEVLEGEHEEKAVILVYSEKNEKGERMSVNSIGIDGKSFFVVDMSAIQEVFEEIVPEIAEELGVELSAEEAMTTYEAQQNESAERLAFSKGIEAYSMHIEKDGNTKVEKVVSSEVN